MFKGLSLRKTLNLSVSSSENEKFKLTGIQ